MIYWSVEKLKPLQPKPDPRDGYDIYDRFSWYEVDRMLDRQRVVSQSLNIGGKTEKMIAIPELGEEFIVLPEVFPPEWPDPKLLARVVREEIHRDERVLDLGTGCGIQGIVAAKRGARVLSTDISSRAVECAQMNAEKQSVSHTMEVIKSDLFDELEGHKFDVIIFNPPFRPLKPRHEAERATVDEDYQTLRRFFVEARDHLTKGGKILMVFSDSGDKEYFESLADANDYHREKIAESAKGYSYTAYRFTI